MRKELVTLRGAARLLEVPFHELRRWEKKGLLRIQSFWNGQRLFDVEQLSLVKTQQNGGSRRPFVVLRSDKPTKYRVIELFAGCGGMALGFENAGLRTELLVEIDRDASSTLKLNRPHWRVIEDDVANVAFTKYRDKIDVVAGGFPCQAFSYAGKGQGFGDTRGTLFFEFARCVAEVRPRIAIAENVRGLIQHHGGRTLATMVGVLEDLGYETKYKMVRAQFLDVPQKRERLVILALRKESGFAHAFPTERNYTISIKEALRDCPPSPGASYPPGKRKIMELVPAGGYWRDLPPKLRAEYMKASLHLSGGKTGMARRLSWDEPSLTLTCNPAQKQTERCHPDETRPLSVREYARIQAFPDDWQFSGSLASQYRQIGNAVPVNLGFHLGSCVIAILQRRVDKDVVDSAPDQDTTYQMSLLHA